MRDWRPVLLAGLLAGSAVSADPAPLFEDNTVIDVRIEAPLKVLMDVRPEEAYLEGTLTYTEPEGRERRLPVKLQTRGNYRRDKSHCDFAPVRLNFAKSDVYDTLFAGQDKLKLVTHCRSRDFQFEHYVLREYIAYRLFAALSDTSFRVRLLRLSYHDPHEDTDLTRYGFVIEDDKAVARRNDLQRVKVRQANHADHDASRQNLVHVFQYMIGNTEYSLTTPEPDKSCCHNMRLLSATREAPFVALPFDFDFSGLVSAPYAEPNPRYPIRTVRTRLYKGRCDNNALLPGTLDLFQRKREDLFAIIDEVAGLDRKAARAMRKARRYIEKFYSLIDDPDEVRKRLVEHCDEPS